VDIVFETERVSKRFRIAQNRPATLKELFIQRLKGRSSGTANELWALREISFTLKKGRSVGFRFGGGRSCGSRIRAYSTIFEVFITKRLMLPMTEI
jgi:ABC-type polysaccharide/polyol phosphate transport system ATPase subunit